MALEVKKINSKETSQEVVRRFFRKVKQSGILIQARKNRFYERKKNKQMEKRAALRRKQLMEEYQRLEKLGQIDKIKKKK